MINFPDELPLRVKPFPDDDARIVRAACYVGEQVFAGWRHGTILTEHFVPRDLVMTQQCQGFVDQHGWFWTRWQSARIALRAGQIRRIPSVLISESLWDRDGKPRDPDKHYDPAAG